MKKKQAILKQVFTPISSAALLLTVVIVLLTGGISQAAQTNNGGLILDPTDGATSISQETDEPSLTTDEAPTPGPEVTEESFAPTPENTEAAPAATDENPNPEATDEVANITPEATVEAPSMNDNGSTPDPLISEEMLIGIFADNSWSIGNTVFLCQGTEIRQGPGLSFSVHTVVPENDWAVVVKGGPTQADGYTWWDIDRAAAGDPSGGTGWVRQDQANCGDPGGDDNSTPGNNVWQVGNDAYLCQGTQIRTGPGLSFTVHTVVPENDWAVVVKGGPTQADGYTWWDIDRAAAGDPSGGTGWVRQDQADCEGGDDNSTPGNNIWQVGNDAYLCQGTQIRTGPGISFSVHTVVPENDWKVVIIGGPTQTNGLTWWNIDRAAAGDPTGGTGWVRQDQADCNAPGGDDNSTIDHNIWQVGNDAYLCLGTEIRTGPGISFSVHTVVPENDWKVVIIGGPTQTNGLTWWNIDRAAAGDPTGGTGWVIQLQADCQPFTPVPDQTKTVVPPTAPLQDQGSIVVPEQEIQESVNITNSGTLLQTNEMINLNVREGPGTEYLLLGQIPPNSVFQVLERSANNWYRIDFNGRPGWVSGDLVRIMPVEDDTHAAFHSYGGGWCWAHPREVGYFGISTEGHSYPNPVIEMRFPPEVLLAGPPEYQIYFMNRRIGPDPDVSTWTGWRERDDAWVFGIDTGWYARQRLTIGVGISINEILSNSLSWRVDYRCSA